MKTKLLGLILTVVILFANPLSFAQASVVDRSALQAGDASSSANAFNRMVTQSKAITKSEYAIMLHDALDLQIEYFKEPEIKDYYDDIKQDAPYASAVIDLVTVGIFESKGNFNPNKILSREEMVHYVMKAYRYKMGDRYVMIKIGPATFKDADKISTKYKGEVAQAQHYKLILGNNKNLFQPKKAATIAASALVINRLLDLLKDQNQQVSVIPEAVVNADSIEMKLTLTNNTKYDLYIENTCGQKFDFELLDADEKVLYRWSDDYAFTDALTTTRVEAGKTILYNSILSGDDYKAIKDKIVYLRGYITGSSEYINPEGYTIKLN